ncbi:DUF1302 domain-containing protein [Paraburkholderia sp. GAS32]|uniref:DUF1302 domain-containing protein n=1 Tax=Paraburkholderia sp. GAS32 TaxID=3035129 RepID=UPI003D254F6E
MATQQYSGTSSNIIRPGLQLAMVAAYLLFAGDPAKAFEVDTGIPDLSVSWTNTFGYTGGVRTQAQRQYIINSAAGGSDLKFGQGDINTSRFSLLSELVVKYQNNYGFRISGDGWYDPAYSASKADINPLFGASGYANNSFSGYTTHYYRGPGAELLDAYAFGKFFVGDVPINVKIGRHTQYWGEAVFSNTYAVSYSQSPVDGIKGSTNPGAEIKTLFLPLNAVSLQSQVTPSVSLGAQYFLEWEPTRFPVGGTYFGGADFLYKGPNQLPLPGGGALPQIGALEPKNTGNFGVNVQWNVAPIETKFGFYYRKFDDYTPWVAPEITANAYRLVYPQSTQLFGVTAARDIAGASIGAEISYRKNTALSPSGINPVNNQGPSGNTWNAVLNAIWVLDKTRFYDTGSAILELTFNHLSAVTSNPTQFNGVGYGSCTYKWNGCATKDFVGVAYSFDPQWLQVFPSVDIDMPVFINYGLYGNAANNGGGYQGAATYSIGVNFKYQSKYDLTLSYEGFYARTHNQGPAVLANGAAAYNDKGWVFLTFKAGF